MESQNHNQSSHPEISILDEPAFVPDNNMPLAIIAVILSCCSVNCIGFVLGILAIIYASQVNSKYIVRDYAGAKSAAENAKILSFISLGLLLLGIIASILFVIIEGLDFYISLYEEILKNS
ncbi:MAG: CD225/dispanin family protein [Flavobacteriaceae bacterium]|jgi:uncharacterized membrane protein|nr:CD225/dispanin family protein [Flavobacteriaceae bacterium]